MTRGAWGLYPAAFGLLLWPNMALAHGAGTSLPASIVLGFFFAYVCFRLAAIPSFGREASDDRVLNSVLRILGLICLVLPITLFIIGEVALHRLQPGAGLPASSGERQP